MSISDNYQVLSDIEHILLKPGMYIGSTQLISEDVFIAIEDSIIKKPIEYIAGLQRLYEEILLNAFDQTVREGTNCTEIHVHIDQQSGTISVLNNGQGLPIVLKPELNVYIPEMVFGMLRSGSNYGDEDRITGGTNGLGAKLANIFSTSFILETADSDTKKIYHQEWYDRMSRKTDPKISSLGRKKPYTRITFQPDLEYFKISQLSDDMIALMKKRLIDIGFASSSKVKIYFNDEDLTTKKPEAYMRMYAQVSDYEDSFIVDSSCERWTIGLSMSANGFTQASFVNGIHTSLGGSHVDHVMGIICKEVIEKLKIKKIEIKPSDVKNKLALFLKSTIVNPVFDSQTKECLKMSKSRFGSEYIMSDAFRKKLLSGDLMKVLASVSETKLLKDLSKTNGVKTNRLVGVKGLEDANWAGTAKSQDTKLILTEGLSAKTFAMSAITVIGRDRFGIFPLKGKPLNVRGTAISKVTANAEICSIVKILGLKYGEKYQDTRSLRYGGLILLTDSDVDGFHICGLIMNIIHYFWPELLRIGFVGFCSTPIVKIYHNRQVLQSFYSLNNYEEWLRQNPKKNITTKYFKGLGTSTSAEARDALTDIDRKITTFGFDEHADATVELVFDKKLTHARKEWLMQRYDRNANIDRSLQDATISDYLNKEMIHFSYSDNQRSLPNIMDGLKPSQRKILYTAIKYLSVSEMKVAQFGAKVAEKTDYHHGEVSLMGAVINMAQNYMGSNNINLLEPLGAFGCLDPDTEVMLWDGGYKIAKDVVVGDQLIGDDGQVRNVLQITEGIDEMYEVNLINGLSYKVNSQHKLTLTYSGNKTINWRQSDNEWRINYFNTELNKLSSKTISTKDSSNKKKTYNKSTLSKEEAFDVIKTYKDELAFPDIFDIKVCDYLKLPKSVKSSLRSVLNESIMKWPSSPVPMDPYILGIWLGDGNSNGMGIAGTDIEVITSYAIWLDTIGVELVHDINSGGHECSHYSTRNKNGKTSGKYRTALGDLNHSKETCIGCQTSNYDLDICNWKFDKTNSINNDLYQGVSENGQNRKELNANIQYLKGLGLYNNKHIPQAYIYNDQETRLQLLAGFIDTDGCVKYQKNTPSIEISQSARLRGHIIDSLAIIARSLGFRTSIGHSGKNQRTKKGEDASSKTLLITGKNLNIIPMRVQRKKIQPYTISTNRYNVAFTITPIGPGPFNGWELDGNHRFLLNNGIITHNSRLHSGSDAASPRYIFTKLSEIAKQIFDHRDSSLLTYLESDHMQIEPEWFAPVIPMILVNGALGIGSGFSTEILKYNPIDICDHIMSLLDNRAPTKELIPWYRGFKGSIDDLGKNKYCSNGCFTFDDEKHSMIITELPIGVSTDDYKDIIEAMIADKENTTVIDIIYGNSDVIVYMEVVISPKMYPVLKKLPTDRIRSLFKLSSKLSCTNMYLFNHEGIITGYPTVYDIIQEFYDVRYQLYVRRREAIMAMLQYDLMIVANKVRLIRHVKNGKLNLRSISDQDLLQYLIHNKFNQDRGVYGEPLEDPTLKEFAYLIDMPIRTITEENAKRLKKKQAEKQAELDAILKETPTSLWKADLEQVLELNQITNDSLKQENADAKTTTKKSKSKTKSKKPGVSKK